MITTTAIVAREPEQPLTINWAMEEVEVYTPGEGEILVEMRATGICHTDIVLSSVPSGSIGIQYPKILGHEGISSSAHSCRWYKLRDEQDEYRNDSCVHIC